MKRVNESLSSNKFNVEFWNEEILLDLPKNSWNVFVGQTGCGKTEVIKQIASILRLRGKSISYVAQNPYLYNDSVRSNIFLGNEVTKEKEDQAYELLQLFGLDYLESSREALFDLEVGEHGKRLSGGQAKRLCLVRSLMSDGEIIVWDDPFSSVDLILEKQIFTKLKDHPLSKDRTFILSSHRLTTVRLSNYAIYLDKELGLVDNGYIENILTNESKIYEYFKNQMV